MSFHFNINPYYEYKTENDKLVLDFNYVDFNDNTMNVLSDKIGSSIPFSDRKYIQDGTFKIHSPSVSQVTSTLQFNNIKHNLAILSGPQIAAISLLILCLFTIFHFVEQTSFDDKTIPYQIFLYRLLLLEPIVIRLIVPIWHLSVSKELRVFIGMRINDMT